MFGDLTPERKMQNLGENLCFNKFSNMKLPTVPAKKKST